MPERVERHGRHAAQPLLVDARHLLEVEDERKAVDESLGGELRSHARDAVSAPGGAASPRPGDTLVKYYAERGLLRRVDGRHAPEVVSAEILAALEVTV